MALGQIVGGVGGQCYVEGRRIMLIGSRDIGRLVAIKGANMENLLWLGNVVGIRTWILIPTYFHIVPM
jgi:hypothetical protein